MEYIKVLTNTFFILSLLRIAHKDMKTKTIPNVYLLPLIILTIIAYITYKPVVLVDGLLGCLIISVPMLMLTMMKPGSFGGGDIKLSIVCGGYLGTVAILKAAVVAVFLAALYIVLFYKKHNLSRKSQIAFGPYLAMGCMLLTYAGK